MASGKGGAVFFNYVTPRQADHALVIDTNCSQRLFNFKKREEVGAIWEELRGRVRDERYQNTMYKILGELIKIFILKSENIQRLGRSSSHI